MTGYDRPVSAHVRLAKPLMKPSHWITVLCLLAIFVPTASAEDTIEFLTGAKITGVVKEIRKESKEFDFEAKIGSRAVTRTYPFSKVHAVTFRGSRFVLTPMEASTESRRDASGQIVRSKSEIDRVIEQVGSSPPDWSSDTPLDYPETLDLTWPLKPEGKWNNKRNMGQYIWDIIHPNPSKWHGGIKLVEHCAELHKGNSTLLERDFRTLGRMYFELLQDYPRAAYWLRRGNAAKGEHTGVMLAECYWRLGNQPLAMQQLTSRNYNAGAAARAVKLYANMGVLDEAMKMAARITGTNASYEGYIAAGDAMRQAGRFDEAIKYYTLVLNDRNFRNDDYEDRFKARARESIEAIELFEKVDVQTVSDGTYSGSSTGYNGRLDVAVTVSGGRIDSVKVTNHQEKQFYSALTDTEDSILKLQTVRGVDGTSGATITSRAIVNAAAKALAAGSP